MGWRLGLLAVFALLSAAPVHAGIIFNRHSKQPAKPNGSDVASQLIRIVSGDADERRRAAAAVELGKVDLRQHPEAGKALIEVLRGDSSATVRGEAAQALGRMRPLTQQVAEALDAASSSDSVLRVRQLARNSLTAFLQAGYKPGNQTESPTHDPSYAGPVNPPVQPSAPAPLPSPFVRRNIRPLAPANETGEPPLAEASPVESAKPAIPSTPLKAAPSGTNIPAIQPPLATEEPNAPTKTPAPKKDTKPKVPAKPEVEGPILNGPG